MARHNAMGIAECKDHSVRGGMQPQVLSIALRLEFLLGDATSKQGRVKQRWLSKSQAIRDSWDDATDRLAGELTC